MSDSSVNASINKTTTQPIFVVMAGGTGGHVIPGLAVAKLLQQKGLLIHWLGTKQGIEARLVPAAGINIDTLDIQGLRGKGIVGWLIAPWRIFKSVLAAGCILHRLKPKAVLSMGGFVAGPGGIAAWLLRIPLLVHEQNAIPGLTNRVLSIFANKTMLAFPQAMAINTKIIYTGNPVRPEIANLSDPAARLSELSSKHIFKLLILGGSLGAAAINQIVPKALKEIANRYIDRDIDKVEMQVWHQTGIKDKEITEAYYLANNINAKVMSFIDDMAEAYAFADLVICRAGALTIAELAAAGVASILIPFPSAVDDHQTENARFLTQHEAAILVSQKDMTPELLYKHINFLIANPDKRLEMAQKARLLAKPDATLAVATECYEVCCE